MPSTSRKQATIMAMALAVKHGHKLEGLREGTQEKLHAMADRMSEKQLRDHMKVKKP